jgi:hypothetical protein
MKQEGQADIQFTEAGMKAYKAYDPKNDYAGACLPMVGRAPFRDATRSRSCKATTSPRSCSNKTPGSASFRLTAAPSKRRQGAHHVVWEYGRTLGGRYPRPRYIGINGYIMLDYSHPLSTEAHIVQKFTRTDFGHIDYEMIVEDPIFYKTPIRNKRTFALRPNWETMEYSCEETNIDQLRNGTITWKPPELYQ